MLFVCLADREDLLAQCGPSAGDPGAFPSGSEDGIEDLEENKVAAMRSGRERSWKFFF